MSSYTCEYAKSGRAKCKGCQEAIDKDALRIGKMIQSTSFDGLMAQWFHVPCFFKKNTLVDVNVLDGYLNVKPSDQDVISGYVNGSGARGARPTAAASSSSSSLSSTALISPVAVDGNLTCEYAKSNRSKCVKCAASIDKDVVRLGKEEPSDRYDGMVTRWYHLDCAFKALVVLSTDSIAGLDNLRPADQDEVRALVAKHSPLASSDAAAAAASVRDARKAGKRSSPDDEGGSSNGDGSAKKRAKSGSAVDYSSFTVAALRDKCKERSLPSSGAKAALIERLTAADAGGGGAGGADDDDDDDDDTTNGKGNGSGTTSQPTTATPATPADPDAARFERELRDESARIWKLRDEVKDRLHSTVVTMLLDHNGMSTKGGPGDLLASLVEAMLYGAIPQCPQCSSRSVHYKDGAYRCRGSTEWSACIWSAPDVKRTPFVVPPQLSGYDYLDTWTFVRHEKPLAAHQHKAKHSLALREALEKKNEAEREAREARQAEFAAAEARRRVFGGTAFALYGKDADFSTPVAQLRESITTHGGVVVTDIDAATVVIASADAARANRAKDVKQANANGIPILRDTFITESIAKQQMVDPDTHAVGKASCATLTVHIHQVRSAQEAAVAAVSSSKSLGGGSGAKSQGKSSGGSGIGGKSKSGTVTLKVNGRGVVDPDSGLDDTGKIYEDKAGDVYSATLSMTDAVRNSNTFYILQLIEEGGRSYHLFRKWGRLGTDQGDNKLEAFSSLESAKSAFCKLYEEKTGNSWTNHKNFQKKPGKFNQVEVDYGSDSSTELKNTMESDRSSKLPESVQALIRIIFDIKQMQTALMSMEIDLEKMPLGKLSKAHITKGFHALNEIQELLQSATSEADRATTDYKAKLLAASSKFYSIIPHDFGTKRVVVIDTVELLQQRVEVVEALLEMEVATNLLREAETATSPIDAYYAKLNAAIQPVDRASVEFDLINKYLQSTHATTHRQYDLELVDLFTVERDGEGARFDPFAHDKNRKLLWHGSRTTNFVGILSQGLRIAPPSAPVTGYMFGKGIYLADSSSKSANYCFTSSVNNTGFMLLCEAALGDMYECKSSQYMEKAPKGYLSTKGAGGSMPNPKNAVTLPNGAVLPMGPLVPSNANSTLLYNEFIVYDVAQVKVRYLLRLNFNYTNRIGFGW